MSTLVQEEAVAGGQPPPGPAPRPQRGGGWRASWRIALRMARRDVRRHRGRSIVVLLMVGIPAMLLVASLSVAATSQVEGAERIPGSLGAAQARIEASVDQPIAQGPDPDQGWASGDTAAAARPIPGYESGASPFANSDAIGDLVGAPVAPFVTETTRVVVGDRTRSLATLATTRPQALGEKVRLVSGRWPTGPTEVLVSDLRVGDGLPASGPLTLSGPKGDRLEVVGTVRATGDSGQRYDLVATTPRTSEGHGGWFVLGDGPVTWSQVRELNTYGLPVLSAAVLRDPPHDSELDPRIVQGQDFGQARASAGYALAGALIIIITTLLIGPAFAVSAGRQRRTLALAAANGATSAQLRRAVLAQALVLGGLSALVATVLGVIGAWAFVRIGDDQGWLPPGPFDVPWGQVAAISSVAVVSSIIAALLPASRLARLDIVGAMRGQQHVTRPSRPLFIGGLVLAGLGSAGVLHSVRQLGSELYIVLSAVALVLGALLAVPTILDLLGRLGGRLPLPLRLASRDLARHRTRSAPTVAAVLAGTAALTLGLVGVSSDTEQRRQEYQPQTIQGEAVVRGSSTVTSPEAAATYEAALPELTFTPVSAVGVGDSTDLTKPFPVVTVVPKGCTPEQAIMDPAWDTVEGAATGPAGSGPPCQIIGSSSGALRDVQVMPATEIVHRFRLRGADARTVTEGGVLVLTLPTDRPVVTDGRVAVADGTRSGDETTGESVRVDVRSTTRLPAVQRPYDSSTMPLSLSAGLVVPTEVATAQGWRLEPRSVLVRAAQGPISDPLAERLDTLVGDDEGDVWIERGFDDPAWIFLAVLLGIFTVLLLVVTLTSTALSLAEQERDQATLAAVGASGRTRRVMVGAQGWVLALVGVVLGVAVGLIPGIAITYPLTAMSYDPVTGQARTGEPVLVIPWLALALMVLVVPAVAGLLATLAVRRSPGVTRRET